MALNIKNEEVERPATEQTLDVVTTAHLAGQPLLCVGDAFAATDLPLVEL